ncbi:hypothetical protein [Desulfonatronum thioautotrophicum]|uniref:hypothetical protein n=1 Tax=Desulfonatronum thioautotrophicum TaxID=617001 RepID=UPI0012946AEF|nr:hypothetical protein [Desulfonatronum thioautotrophicum]
MGKGGYIGGSTIIVLRSSQKESAYEINPFEHNKFVCEICKIKLIRMEYFTHLKIVHGLSGCSSCGKPYAKKDKNTHICKKCGKKIILKLSSSKKQTQIEKQKSTLKKNICHKKIIQTKKEKNVVSNPKPITNKKKKFGISLGDVLLEAIKKKNEPND